MGSDTTPNGLRFQFTDRIKPVAQRQLDMRKAGLDPKDVDLEVKSKQSKGQRSSLTFYAHFLLRDALP